MDANTMPIPPIPPIPPVPAIPTFAQIRIPNDDLARLAITSAADHHSDGVYIVMMVLMAVVTVAVGVPAITMHYRWKQRQMDLATAREDGTNKDLWDTARRMEQRIGYLETVLDTEVPGWRSRSNVR
jgi:phage shock protein B